MVTVRTHFQTCPRVRLTNENARAVHSCLWLNLVDLLLSWEEQNLGRCDSSSSAGSSKIKNRTSSCNKANRALLHDEVRFLIFDSMTENQASQRPESRSREGKLSNPRGRAARARCMIFFFENLRKPARVHCAGAMRQFCTAQVNSTFKNSRGSRHKRGKQENLAYILTCVVPL